MALGAFPLTDKSEFASQVGQAHLALIAVPAGRAKATGLAFKRRNLELERANLECQRRRCRRQNWKTV